MRKIYSLVLMATMLLIGTNAWADVHAVLDENDEAKVQINGGDWQYATHLKEAFDAVGAGQTANIVLLNPVSLSTHITMPSSLPEGGILNQAGQNITLDLNGHDIEAPRNVTVFRLVKGTLNITGSGYVKKITTAGNEGATTVEGKAVITVAGAENKNTANWSTLTIGKDVIVTTVEQTGIFIHDGCTFGEITDNNDPFKVGYANLYSKYGYCTYYNKVVWSDGSGTVEKMEQACGSEGIPMACGAMYNNGTTSVQQGAAFGVKVIIEGTVIAKKRAVQINGTVNQKPSCTESRTQRDPEHYPNPPYYQYNYPYVKIGPDAHIRAAADGGCTGIYASGYGVFDIAGEVSGATGVYMKAGDVKLEDADIRSSFTGSVTYSGGGASGVGGAGGSAIAIESNDAYAGNSGLSITGDTKVTGGSGYAIHEQTYTEDGGATTSHVTIDGGTIQGGTQGAIAITDGALPVTKIGGGNVDASSVTVTNGTSSTTVDITNLFPNDDDYHTTAIEADGKTVIVVSKGTEPTAKTEWTAIAALAAGSNANWTGFTAGTIANGETVNLGELQIVSADGTEGKELQELTVENGGILKVNHLLMNDYARITVEAGGKLIVKGTQGIVAPLADNIVLQASETEQAIFLVHPDVSSNRHPNATVEFTSNSVTTTSPSFYSKQRFGIPTWKQLNSITTENGGSPVQTAISSFSYANNEWTDVSWINVPAKDENLNLIADPFAYYQMQHNTPNAGTIVTMTGELYGNTSPVLGILANSWNGFANSYMAPINADELMDMIPNTVDKAFQIYELPNTPGVKGSWKAVSKLDLEDIRPMQAFLIRNTKAAADVTVDYADAVYYPTSGETKPSAPARRGENITKAKLIVMGESYMDQVLVAEDAQFSAEFDNGYDAAKYMNDGINLYVSADEKMAIFATDNLENTYLGFQAVNGGNYTIEFANVQGEDLTLIDLDNNASVVMVEGNKYEFTATANSANDYRFKIVSTFNAPTAIDNTNAVKSAKGIYTITGQYVGEMNVWNSLPAGIYVIDGAKRVK